jgi:hypothetical protein
MVQPTKTQIDMLNKLASHISSSVMSLYLLAQSRAYKKQYKGSSIGVLLQVTNLWILTVINLYS